MSRILDSDGAYAPEVSPAAAVPKTVDPRDLPATAVDPYKGVDILAFDEIPTMDAAALMKMGEIAESRGNPAAALQWKAAATARNSRDASAADQQDMFDSFRPEKQAMLEPGSKIVAPQVDTPWHTDSEYQRLQTVVAIANEKAEQAKTPAAQLEANAALATAQADLRDRETAVRETAVQSGAWTVEDERKMEALGSLEAKAQQVQAQLWPAQSAG